MAATDGVTLLFTDIEGSTSLWERHAGSMAAVIAEHDALLARLVAACGGRIFKTTGDGVCAVFECSAAALAAAGEVLRATAAHDFAVGRLTLRAAVDRGPVHERDGDLFGPVLNRCARLLAAAHGGQVLVGEAAARDSAVALIDLGEHRLRDIERPQRVYQLAGPGLRERFPPLRQLESFAHNLPASPGELIGRQRELAEVARLLARGRLVTLTGSGGSGKTRLAVAVAADLLERFPDGVWFVDLASVGEPVALAAAVAAVLGLREEAGAGLEEVLPRWLSSRRMLLLLDNCEHLVDACAALAERLLAAGDGVRLLATSIAPLLIAGEQIYRVPPLGLPAEDDGAEAIDGSEAMRLLVERGRAAEASFALDDQNRQALAAICRGLDGLPLAIELAAAMLRLLTPAQLAARLDDRFGLLRAGHRTAPARQQTLAAAVDWGHELLSAPARRLFRRLSVFAGGFDWAAAEAIGGEAELLSLLGELVDKSFVTAEERDGAKRFRLLETLRLYGRARLAAAGEEPALRAAHRDWYAGLAEAQEPRLRGPEQAEALSLLQLEHDNLRTALSCALETATDTALRLVAALWRFWYIRGFLSEGLDWCERALAGSATSPHRDEALNAAGNLATTLGRWELAEARYSESQRLRRERGDDGAVARSLSNLGLMHAERGDFRAALRYHEEALDTARANPDERMRSTVLVNAAGAYLGLDRRREGIALLDEALPLVRRAEDHVRIASVQHNRGWAAYHEGEHGEAAARLRESLESHFRLANANGAVRTILCLAQVAAAAGANEPAAVLFAAADARLRSPLTQCPDDCHEIERIRTEVTAALTSERLADLWQQGGQLADQQILALCDDIAAHAGRHPRPALASAS